MIVKDLIDELKKMPQDWPVCINDCMGFVERMEKVITVEKKQYITFPFTETDKFYYVNLKGQKFDY